MTQQLEIESLMGKLKILNNTIRQEEVGSVRHCVLVSLRKKYQDDLDALRSTKG